MAGIVARKAGTILLIIFKWILQILLIVLKLVLRSAKLFLMLFTLVIEIVLIMAGVPVRRR